MPKIGRMSLDFYIVYTKDVNLQGRNFIVKTNANFLHFSNGYYIKYGKINSYANNVNETIIFQKMLKTLC